MQMNVSVQDFAPPSQNGNGTLTNLTGYPVLSVQGTSSVQVMYSIRAATLFKSFNFLVQLPTVCIKSRWYLNRAIKLCVSPLHDTLTCEWLSILTARDK